MNVRIIHGKTHTDVCLEGALVLDGAEELRAQLAVAALTSERLQLDLADVTEIDTAGLQVLLALGNEGKPLSLSAASPAVMSLLNHAHLHEHFGLEPAHGS